MSIPSRTAVHFKADQADIIINSKERFGAGREIPAESVGIFMSGYWKNDL